MAESPDAVCVRFDRDGVDRWIVKRFSMTEATPYPDAGIQLRLPSHETQRPAGRQTESGATPEDEGHLIVDTLRGHMVEEWDGRTAIVAMRDGGSSHWRQMEWIGFYFEYLCRTILWSQIGGALGPSYGNTTFDYARRFVWDLKAHPHDTALLIVNDASAFRECLIERSYLGVVIVEGKTEYDTTGTFKRWHDEIKGGTSAYESARIARGAPSRRRKVAFKPTDCYAVVFHGVSDLESALQAGWVTDTFQLGMRNSNGTLRRAKIALVPNKIPGERLVR